ncbi:MAG: polysaccharide deacetylase family protein [Clostridiaceae bacterium]
MKLLRFAIVSLFMVIVTIFIINEVSDHRMDEAPEPFPNNGVSSQDAAKDPSNPVLNADRELSSNSEGVISNSQAPTENLNSALIIFTFDDGNESDYVLAYSILKKYGIKGTSYISPYYSDHQVKHKLSWNQIKEMAADGWDFEDHTYSHINMAKSAPEQIRQSMEQVNKAFTANGLKIPVALAYPYGKFVRETIDIVKEYRAQARLAYYADDFVDLSNVDLYRIPCVSADMRTEERLKEKERLVDKACSENGIIVFRVHCLYRNEVDDMGKEVVQTSSKLFEKLVSHCVKKGCAFTTMNNFP